jgi:hypothetical protein
MAEKDQSELLTGVLNITRDQLTRSMNLNAELEALLTFERSKNAELEQRLAEQPASKEDQTKK